MSCATGRGVERPSGGYRGEIPSVWAPAEGDDAAAVNVPIMRCQDIVATR